MGHLKNWHQTRRLKIETNKVFPICFSTLASRRALNFITIVAATGKVGDILLFVVVVVVVVANALTAAGAALTLS
jgi:hypothetical protein